jgi:hypothetical protein
MKYAIYTTFNYIILYMPIKVAGRLIHDLSSPTPTLRSWVRIALEAWISMCLSRVCVVLSVGSGLATG